MTEPSRILVYAYGNPGRNDDGLGDGLIELLTPWIQKQNLGHIKLDSNYQLNIEDAEVLVHYDKVIFVDASLETDIDTYKLTEVSAADPVIFTSHAASPGYLYQLAKDMFEEVPPVYLLHIRGYEWAFCEGLSDRAQDNLLKAFEFMKNWLTQNGS